MNASFSTKPGSTKPGAVRQCGPVPSAAAPLPLVRRIPYVEILFYIFMTYVFFLAAERFESVESYRQPSIIIFVFHSIFLYIHEGGHFLFSFFGTTLYILGGSFWQVMFPFLSFLIAIRDRATIGAFALFLTGFNLMDVSVYMRDAPYRQLPLLGGHKSGHDWYNLFIQWDMLNDAATAADMIYYTGYIVCIASIVAGFYFAYRTFKNPPLILGERERDSFVENTMEPQGERTQQRTGDSTAENSFF